MLMVHVHLLLDHIVNATRRPVNGRMGKYIVSVLKRQRSFSKKGTSLKIEAQ